MAQVVTQTVNISDVVTETLTYGTTTAASVQASSTPTFSYSNGTVSGSIDLHWEHTYTLASSASTTITLSALTDDLGRTVAFARVKRLSINITTKIDGDTLTVGGAASNDWTAIVGATGQKFIVHLYDLKISSDTASFVVTASSSDQLKFLNSGSNSMTFIVSISGCSV